MNTDQTELVLDRLSTIYSLVGELGDSGKIKIQKFIYFLQEGNDVPLGYKFRMYRYGPYSDGVESYLSTLKAFGFVDIEPSQDGYGFHVTPRRGAQDDLLDGRDERYRSLVTKVTEDFRGFSSTDLELMATVHFSAQLNKGNKQRALDVTSGFKPKFTMKKIEWAYDYLVDKGYLAP